MVYNLRGESRVEVRQVQEVVTDMLGVTDALVPTYLSNHWRRAVSREIGTGLARTSRLFGTRKVTSFVSCPVYSVAGGGRLVVVPCLGGAGQV